jgi:hypothetical protein
MVPSICARDVVFSARAMFFTLEWLLLLGAAHNFRLTNQFTLTKQHGTVGADISDTLTHCTSFYHPIFRPLITQVVG